MERIRACLVALALASLCCVAPVRSSASDHRYKAGDEVPLYANKEKKEVLGEVLNGGRLVSAPYKIDFLSEKDAEIACKKKLTKEEVAKFRTAADPSNYKYFLFKRLVFEILYNKDRVIEINVQSDPNAIVDLTGDEPIDVDFIYTVKWKEADTPFEKRMEKTADEEEENGWKYIHGDVFRFPKHKSLLAAALGSGTQLSTLTNFIFILALVGPLSIVN
ncbi:P-loop containing nucleoside triphosphate hydrolases superfamily protein isoform 1 [Hibiscus syriacus]|uniref:Transmembrane 9 superfamily member n=1 Tax=Hibiscus syriacus TaxID=106335 RepID=A0A6A2XLJ7_HIBSY|nr:P-loop containing nucleoside triphosphate hydrolases superfamily protein isoform 1 [Hibiscus syriacus]